MEETTLLETFSFLRKKEHSNFRANQRAAFCSMLFSLWPYDYFMEADTVIMKNQSQDELYLVTSPGRYMVLGCSKAFTFYSWQVYGLCMT